MISLHDVAYIPEVLLCTDAFKPISQGKPTCDTALSQGMLCFAKLEALFVRRYHFTRPDPI